MRLVLSPYHLTSREPAAMAALLLAEGVVTYLPEPPAGVARDAVRAAFLRHPRYARLLEAWRWSVPLWRAGVISARQDGHDAVCQVRAAAERIRSDRQLASLRPFAHEGLFGPENDAALDVLAADMLKGGPDPGICVPIGAGLDDFAFQNHLAVARAGASGPSAPARATGGRPGTGRDAPRPSLAQRAESAMGQTLFTFAVPVLTQCAAETLLAARESLAGARGELLRAVEGCVPEARPESVAALRAAASRFAAGFESFAAPLRGHDDADARQVRDAFVRVTGRLLPADAVLRAAVAAARVLNASPAPVPGARVDCSEPSPRVFTLVMDVMSVRPGAAPVSAAAQNGPS